LQSGTQFLSRVMLQVKDSSDVRVGFSRTETLTLCFEVFALHLLHSGMVTVGLKLDLDDRLASFSALTLLVGSSGL